MRDATDRQLKEWGWRWAYRLNGEVMAVTVHASDAARWIKSGNGEVINLSLVT